MGSISPPTRFLLIAEASMIYALYVYKFGLLSWLRLCYSNAGLPSRYPSGSTAHRTCITFNHIFYFFPFFFFPFWCSFSPLWLTLSCFCLLPKNNQPQFLSPHWSQHCCISLPVHISDIIADVLMALHRISATVAWTLLTLRDYTHQKVPRAPLQLSMKFEYWSHNCPSTVSEIQPFFTALSIKLISFSLCCVSSF